MPLRPEEGREAKGKSRGVSGLPQGPFGEFTQKTSMKSRNTIEFDEFNMISVSLETRPADDPKCGGTKPKIWPLQSKKND